MFQNKFILGFNLLFLETKYLNNLKTDQATKENVFVFNFMISLIQLSSCIIINLFVNSTFRINSFGKNFKPFALVTNALISKNFL